MCTLPIDLGPLAADVGSRLKAFPKLGVKAPVQMITHGPDGEESADFNREVSNIKGLMVTDCGAPSLL